MNSGGCFLPGLLNTGSMFINNPELLNQRLKQLSTLPNMLSRDDIEQALVQPDFNELPLRMATHSSLYLTYPLYRLQYLYEGILKYRSYIQPVYVDKREMDKPRFLNEQRFIDKWHKKLNPKKQFRRIVAEVIPEGKKAYYIRQSYTKEENVNFVFFQELPSDWYKIIKHSTDSFAVVAFNFAYFWQAGTSLGQFPPIFTKYYEEMMCAVNKDKNGEIIFDTTRTPADVVLEYNKDKLEWFYWKELPANECFVFSFTEADNLQISPFSSLLLQAQDLGTYALLQQQLLSVPLYSMLLGEMPLAEGNKTGNRIDDFRLSPEAVATFESKVNSFMPPGTKFAMVPSVKNELHHFEEVPNANKIYDSGLQQMINTTGASTLMTTNDKPSVAQVNAGKIIETRFIDRMYDQFEWAINIILDDMFDNGDLRYQWHFRIFGDSFSEKDKISELEKSLSLGQIQFLPEYLAYHDMTLEDAKSSANWVESSGLYDQFKPLVNSYSISNNSTATSKGGRPKVEETQITNDNTANSIDEGTNTADNR